jgi:hypothetical protein
VRSIVFPGNTSTWMMITKKVNAQGKMGQSESGPSHLGESTSLYSLCHPISLFALLAVTNEQPTSISKFCHALPHLLCPILLSQLQLANGGPCPLYPLLSTQIFVIPCVCYGGHMAISHSECHCRGFSLWPYSTITRTVPSGNSLPQHLGVV